MEVNRVLMIKKLKVSLALLLFWQLAINGCCPMLSKVEVFFDSKPAGASLWIEGQFMGYQTPISLPLYPGKYRVTLKKEGYHDWQEEVQIKEIEGQKILAELVVAQKKEITIQLHENNGQDASVLAFHPYGNYGQEATLGVGSNLNPYQNLIYRSYLQFDLGRIPEEAKILEAKLGLFFNSDGKPEQPAEITIYPVLEEWEEDCITWESQPDIAVESCSVATVPASLTMDFVWWDITGIIQDWHNQLVENHGLVLQDSEEETIDGGKGFASSESETSSQHPLLRLEYYLP